MNNRSRNIKKAIVTVKVCMPEKRWIIEDEIEKEFEDAVPGVCGHDWADAQTVRWMFYGTEAELREMCIRRPAYDDDGDLALGVDTECEDLKSPEDRWEWEADYDPECDPMIFDENKDGNFSGYSYSYNDEGTTRIYVTRRYWEDVPERTVRLVRYLDKEDEEQLNQNGELRTKGITHAYNNSEWDGKRIFCFIEGHERRWDLEGYVPAVERIVIEVKEDRIDYHFAHYGTTTNNTREATIEVIREEDIVERKPLGLTEADSKGIEECEKRIADENEKEKAVWQIVKEKIQQRELKGNYAKKAFHKISNFLKAGKPIEKWKFRTC